MTEKPNIALVVLDTLRKDAFDDHFDWLPGTRHENAWATSNWTVPVHASMFTGKYASEVGIVSDNQRFDCDKKFVQEVLQERGYRTTGISANPNISPTFGADRGFDRFRGSWRLRNMQEDGFDWDKFIHDHMDEGPSRYFKALSAVIRHDSSTLQDLRRGVNLKLRDSRVGSSHRDDGAQEIYEMLNDMKFNSSGEFLFLNLMEAHTPYDPPNGWKSVDVELSGLVATLSSPAATEEDIKQAYDDSVKYLSHMYKQIYEDILSNFDIVITVGDHGEMLGEHGIWEHAYGIHPELVNIPMCVTGREVNSSIFSLRDIYSLILGEEIPERENIYIEHHGIPDRNLSTAERRLRGDYQYLKNGLRGIVREDYQYESHRGTEYGPGDLTEIWDRLPPVKIDENDEVSDAVLDQLEELGYA